MRKLKKFISEFEHPALKLSLVILLIIIVVVAMVTMVLTIRPIVTVTNYKECVSAGGKVNKWECEIMGESFSAPSIKLDRWGVQGEGVIKD